MAPTGLETKPRAELEGAWAAGAKDPEDKGLGPKEKVLLAKIDLMIESKAKQRDNLKIIIDAEDMNVQDDAFRMRGRI